MIFSRALCGGIKPTRLWHLTSKKHYKRIMDNRHSAGNRPYYPRSRPEFFRLLALNYAVVGGLVYSYGFFTPKECPGGKEKDVVEQKKKCKKGKGQPCPPEDKGKLPEKCPEPGKPKKK